MTTKRVTRKEVAEHAGVSVAVVSYVVNDGPRPVSPETRLKVQQAIEELGYYPNELARSLSLKQTSTLGLILPNVTNPVFAEIANSLEQACVEMGYMVMLCASERNPEKENKLVQTLRAKQVDAVVINPTQDAQTLLAPLLQAQIPVVILEHDPPNMYSILIDDLAGGRLAAQHLVSLGHRHIGMIKRHSPTAMSYLREVGYEQILSEANIPYDPALVVSCDSGLSAGYAAMKQLLALSEPPTAIFTHNDILATAAIRAIQDSGLNVPDDISVVGYDDIVSSAYLNPRLTTIKVPVAEMGCRAGQIAVELAKNKNIQLARTITLPVELIVRASTGPPRQL